LLRHTESLSVTTYVVGGHYMTRHVTCHVHLTGKTTTLIDRRRRETAQRPTHLVLPSAECICQIDLALTL